MHVCNITGAKKENCPVNFADEYLTLIQSNVKNKTKQNIVHNLTKKKTIYRHIRKTITIIIYRHHV